MISRARLASDDFSSSRGRLCRHSRRRMATVPEGALPTLRDLQVAVRVRRLLHDPCLMLHGMRLDPTILGVALAASR